MKPFFLYGPPGSGKSTLGRALGASLGVPFLDIDAEIEREAGCAIRDIFQREGEAGFRAREAARLDAVLAGDGEAVIALGGGALLNPENRRKAEAAGPVLVLQTSEAVIRRRIGRQNGTRPLLDPVPGGGDRLSQLLKTRMAHYDSFSRRLDVSSDDVEAKVLTAQVEAGAFQVGGMGAGYPVRVRRGILSGAGAYARAGGWKERTALVADEHVAALPAFQTVMKSLAAAGFAVTPVIIPAGEEAKTIDTVQLLWRAFLKGGLERGDGALALGGGVVSDLTGFAAATYLRGIRWAVMPTTLLAMVDASMGGKTGADLPEGKNLVGAFHPPSFVLADPDVLESLPEPVFRSGLAEVVKHGIIADPGLFAICERGWDAVRLGDVDALVRRAMAVKVRTIAADPYEKGIRAALNLGHTIGHAVEKAMSYRLDHGAAVAVGLVAEARLAERMGLAEKGLADRISGVLGGLGLPVRIPEGLDRKAMLEALMRDKKKAGGSVRFALPVRVGDVKVGVTVDPELLAEL
ncbi:MAG: 3-dehydroquinate synthase [Kiritimatiellia bacterium]